MIEGDRAPWLQGSPFPVVRLANVSSCIQTGPFGSQIRADDYLKGGIPLINPSHLRDGNLEPDPDTSVSEQTAQRLARHALATGDVILGRRGELGRAAVVSSLENGWICGTGSMIVRLRTERMLPRFFFLVTCLSGTREWLQLQSVGSTMDNLNASILGRLPLPCPTTDVQRQIVRLLGRKTAAVDELIAKKERLIVLLQEKRQALITHAVTKGLELSATLKESAIRWLGAIPAHWNIKRLKYISPSRTVGVVVSPSSYYVDEGVPFLFGSNVREGDIVLDGVRRIAPESNRLLIKSKLKAGDLVVVRVGYPGVTAVIPPELDGCNCASVMIVRRSDSFVSRWLCYALNSRVGRYQVELVQYGAAQEQFNISHAANWLFPVPPREEQLRIADELDEQCGRIQELVARTATSLDKLREYRQALITAAVTGKLDVTKEPPS
ncbi:restriction endonuclease subunit S [Sorangium sp. So ce1000]|uniref:restriction endonuclease subunit S n=1 Tax=Sorangium sp. So ce1000 TaxID=3133325 RepID=UPI003F5E7786